MRYFLSEYYPAGTRLLDYDQYVRAVAEARGFNFSIENTRDGWQRVVLPSGIEGYYVLQTGDYNEAYLIKFE
ncbi:MAG: hypothetical protein FWD93_00700 [Coriobacteriia bacterium]|nr:hypothetical protein [Coriobacteriia bacterium]